MSEDSPVYTTEQTLGGVAVTPLPCPFCGEPPRLLPTDPSREGNGWGAVACGNQRCPAQPRVDDYDVENDKGGTPAHLAAAVRRWNQRA